MDVDVLKEIKELLTFSLKKISDAEKDAKRSTCGCLSVVREVFAKFDESFQKLFEAREQSKAPSEPIEMQLTGSENATNQSNTPQRQKRPKSKTNNDTSEPPQKRQLVMKLRRINIRDYSTTQSSRTKDAQNVHVSAPISNRRQTVHPNGNFDQNPSPNTVSLRKNTDRQMYFSNPLYRTLCTLCNKNERHLVAHYVKQHAESEVIIARLSPVMADAIRFQNEPFEMLQTKITGHCYFCEEFKTMTKHGWSTHILSHTGESMYTCKDCNTMAKNKREHSGCDGALLTIFAMNSPNDAALTGYLCKECNYLQISRQRILDHLMKQHDVNESDVNQYYEKVWLVPDLSPVKTILRFDYIDPDKRFRCTICTVDFANAIEFEAHLRENHSKIKKYTCICKENLKFSHRNPVVESTLHHLQMHSSDLYRCMLCDKKYTCFSEDDILEHLSKEHAEEKLVYQHAHCERQTSGSLSEISVERFICTTCKVDFSTIGDVVDHYNMVHHGEVFDVIVTVLLKTSKMTSSVSQIETIFSCDQNKFDLCSSFVCSECNFKCVSKENLLIHHNDKHPMNMLNAKMANLALVQKNNEEKWDRSLIYSCYWCYKKDNNDKYIHGNVKAIHDHWLTHHIKPTFNPFKFYVEPLAKCYYCDTMSTYRGLIEHSQTKHTDEPFCFVDANNPIKCLVCDFTNAQSELPAHFESAHSLISDMHLFNPCEMKQELIEQLLDIDVHKKHQCVYCEDEYDTFDEYQRHHAMKHKRLVPNFIEILNSNISEFFVDCCRSHILPQEFLNHLNRHNFQFTCKLCKMNTDSLNEAVKHDSDKHNNENSIEQRWIMLDRTLNKIFYRTKVFFGNVLVLYKQNLIGTSFDDLEIFKRFVETKK